jgi:hypothetical protein
MVPEAIKGVGTLHNRTEYVENLVRSGLIEAEESEFSRHLERFTTHPQSASGLFDPLTQGRILTGFEYAKHDLSMVQVTRIELGTGVPRCWSIRSNPARPQPVALDQAMPPATAVGTPH